MNKFTEEKTVNCKHLQQKDIMWTIKFFWFLSPPSNRQANYCL